MAKLTEEKSKSASPDVPEATAESAVSPAAKQGLAEPPSAAPAEASPGPSTTAQAQAEAEAEAEAPGTPGDDFSDSDSAVGAMSFTSLTSLTDSIREFRRENGRTYHSLSAGKYWCPNDDPENDRLDLQHHAHRLTFGGALCCCPKKHGAKRVLDLGTGTGIWAMEYADEHPEAEVIGVDLSPIQPEFVPPNCSFEVDDIEKEWTWFKPFDFIWWRALLGCFTDVEGMIATCYENLEPGGYLEMHDGTFPLECDDGSVPEDSAVMKISHLAKEASARLGRPIDKSPQYREMMERAGFVDIVFEKYNWPINTWPKDPRMKTIGFWTLANVEGGLEGLFMALLTRGLGMTMEETLVLCAEVRKDLRNRDYHGNWPAYYCYGRKPLSGEVQHPAS